MLYPNVTATLRNVTATGNPAADGGGGIALWTDNGSSLPSTSRSLATAPRRAAAAATYNVDSATLVDSIAAGNVASDSSPDCFSRDTGSLTVRGVNLIEDISGCDLTGPGLGAVISGEDLDSAARASTRPARRRRWRSPPAALRSTRPASGDGAWPRRPRPTSAASPASQGAACDLGAFEARPAVASLAQALLQLEHLQALLHHLLLKSLTIFVEPVSSSGCRRQ